jgi:hypothetical protein
MLYLLLEVPQLPNAVEGGPLGLVSNVGAVRFDAIWANLVTVVFGLGHRCNVLTVIGALLQWFGLLKSAPRCRLTRLKGREPIQEYSQVEKQITATQ